MDGPDLDDVAARERALLDPAVRADRTRLEGLLDEDFSEVGASGRLWTRAAVVDALLAEAEAAATGGSGGAGPVRVEDLRVTALGEEAALVTYRSDPSGRAALRTSVWRRQDGAWRLLRHHGTLASGPPPLS